MGEQTQPWPTWSGAPTEKAALAYFHLQRMLKLVDYLCGPLLSRRENQDPLISKRIRNQGDAYQESRCYGKAILGSFHIWNFYNCIGASMDVLEKQEKTQMQRKNSHKCDPRKGQEGRALSMKLAEKMTMEAKSTRLPFEAQDTVFSFGQ